MWISEKNPCVQLDLKNFLGSEIGPTFGMQGRSRVILRYEFFKPDLCFTSTPMPMTIIQSNASLDSSIWSVFWYIVPVPYCSVKEGKFHWVVSGIEFLIPMLVESSGLRRQSAPGGSLRRQFATGGSLRRQFATGGSLRQQFAPICVSLRRQFAPVPQFASAFCASLDQPGVGV